MGLRSNGTRSFIFLGPSVDNETDELVCKCTKLAVGCVSTLLCGFEFAREDETVGPLGNNVAGSFVRSSSPLTLGITSAVTDDDFCTERLAFELLYSF